MKKLQKENHILYKDRHAPLVLYTTVQFQMEQYSERSNKITIKIAWNFSRTIERKE